MYGVVFDFEEKSNDLVVYCSFGGLLMRVSGSVESNSPFRKEGKDARVYLMIKRA
jgi:hydrogenase maturation factor